MSTDLTFEEWAAMHKVAPAPPGPVTDEGTIATLLSVVGLCWADENPNEPITFGDIMTEVRELLAPGQTIAEADVQRILDQRSTFVPVDGGWAVETI